MVGPPGQADKARPGGVLCIQVQPLAGLGSLVPGTHKQTETPDGITHSSLELSLAVDHIATTTFLYSLVYIVFSPEIPLDLQKTH